MTGQKIIASGFTSFMALARMGLIRVNPDGSLDATTFGMSGKATNVISTSKTINKVYAVGLQSNGKIILGGARVDALGSAYLLTRLNQDKTLDTNFGNNGFATENMNWTFFDFTRVQSIIIQPDDKILVGLLYPDATPYMARFSADGKTIGPGFCSSVSVYTEYTEPERRRSNGVRWSVQAHHGTAEQRLYSCRFLSRAYFRAGKSAGYQKI